ncbi:YbhB/YbcL family Raf kinase inhibitor-like protein [Actinomadura rugatobispora]|uniref:YbhB/YbcL family Raf kinase inhibitor-like protein n=1 Tax=Actinomadura rugatobispora TaxID=1994 RepID=A0ABW1AIQ4_9ACTN|nr:hypothetical protein GCM10010200_082220 [Actinomadura rugatobispora]
MRGAALTWAAMLAGGCGLTDSALFGSVETAELTVTSPAFADTQALPARYACAAYGGSGQTPPLRWSGAPPGTTTAFAIVADVLDTSTGGYVSWVVANIDGNTSQVIEGARPAKAVESLNTSDGTDYVAPCPPRGERHRYRFTVYALSERVALAHGAPLREGLAAIAEKTVGRGRIIGTFEPPGWR